MGVAPVPVRVHDVIVKGNEKTKDHVIEAEVEGVRQATTLQELLEAANVANFNLRALDIFDSVKITLDAGPPDGVCQLDRRGARQEDAAAPQPGSAVGAGAAHPEALRL